MESLMYNSLLYIIIWSILQKSVMFTHKHTCTNIHTHRLIISIHKCKQSYGNSRLLLWNFWQTSCCSSSSCKHSQYWKVRTYGHLLCQLRHQPQPVHHCPKVHRIWNSCYWQEPCDGQKTMQQSTTNWHNKE